MKSYEQQIAQAPGTNPELLKASLIEVLTDVDRRLGKLEKPTDGLPLLNKNDLPSLIELLKEELRKDIK